MNSNSNADYSCDAYYDLPELKYENKEINVEDFDPGEYVLEKKKIIDSNEVEIWNPEKKRPGHKPTIPGVYDDICGDYGGYAYDTDPQVSAVNADKTLTKDTYGCSKQRKIFVGSIIGIAVIGVIATGVVISLQGTCSFYLIKCLDDRK